MAEALRTGVKMAGVILLLGAGVVAVQIFDEYKYTQALERARADAPIRPRADLPPMDEEREGRGAPPPGFGHQATTPSSPPVEPGDWRQGATASVLDARAKTSEVQGGETGGSTDSRGHSRSDGDVAVLANVPVLLADGEREEGGISSAAEDPSALVDQRASAEFEVSRHLVSTPEVNVNLSLDGAPRAPLSEEASRGEPRGDDLFYAASGPAQSTGSTHHQDDLEGSWSEAPQQASQGWSETVLAAIPLPEPPSPVDAVALQAKAASDEPIRSLEPEPLNVDQTASINSTGEPVGGVEVARTGDRDDEGLARELAATYFTVWSSANRPSEASLAPMYGEKVHLNGRPLSREQVLREKRREVEGWPQRRYIVQPESLKMSCDGPKEICTVEAVYASPRSGESRGEKSSGEQNVRLEIAVAQGRALIVGETNLRPAAARSLGSPRKAVARDAVFEAEASLGVAPPAATAISKQQGSARGETDQVRKQREPQRHPTRDGSKVAKVADEVTPSAARPPTPALRKKENRKPSSVQALPDPLPQFEWSE